MFEVIITKGELYDKCKNIEQLYDKFYYPLLVEYKELKKQLEKYKKKLMIATKMEIKEIDENTFVGIDYFQHKCINYENQQKEFIKYLEDEIKITKEKWGNKLTEKGYLDIAMTVRAYQIILQKYKEIIGGNNETDNNQ